MNETGLQICINEDEVTVNASNFAPHENVRATLAISVAFSDEFCTNHEQNKI
jgi:hypothetical protein